VEKVRVVRERPIRAGKSPFKEEALEKKPYILTGFGTDASTN